MAQSVIDGKAMAARRRAAVGEAVARHEAAGGRRPALATVLVGDDPASQVYVRNKHTACEEVGIESVHHALGADSTQEQVVELVAGLGRDPAIDGILVQLPLPAQIDPDAVIAAIDPAKDVDGLTPVNAGRLAMGDPGLVPCTPAAVVAMLDAEGVEIEGVEAVVVGRSALVGRPLSSLLLNRDATVTVCHSRTRDLAAVTRRADILVAAMGRPRTIGPEMVAEGAAVIDVGISRTEDGLVGDVDFGAVVGKAGAITPVPGGVGPMTIAMLLENSCVAAGLDL